MQCLKLLLNNKTIEAKKGTLRILSIELQIKQFKFINYKTINIYFSDGFKQGTFGKWEKIQVRCKLSLIQNDHLHAHLCLHLVAKVPYKPDTGVLQLQVLGHLVVGAAVGEQAAE